MTQLQVIKKEPMMSIGCLTLAGLIVSSDYLDGLIGITIMLISQPWFFVQLHSTHHKKGIKKSKRHKCHHLILKPVNLAIFFKSL